MSNEATNSENPPEIELLFDQYEITEVIKPFVIYNTPQFDRSYKIYFNKSCDPDNFMNELRGLSYIQYVERVPTKTIFECTPQDMPQDEFESYQLDLIQACDAFNLHKGGSRIAIVDNTVFTTHEDLETNVVAMYDATDGDMDLGIPTLWDSHGTHVAGIACAVSDNDVGVSSIGWNNQLIGVKAAPLNNILGVITHGFEGLAWAAMEGDADVINLSWGGSASSEMEYDCIVQARDLGSIIVAAAGNSGTSTPNYPAAYGEGLASGNWTEVLDKKLVVAVANLTQNGNQNTGSTFGDWVDVSAYGTDIYSCLPYGSFYGNKSGTSMAAPLVSGLIGLMQSYAPFSTDIEIIDCLLNSANTDIYDPVNHPYNIVGGLGSGVINAYDALRCLNSDCSAPYAYIIPESINICSGETVNLTASDGIGYSWSTGQSSQTISISQPGNYSVIVTLSSGCTATASVTILPAITNPYVLANGTVNPTPYCGTRSVLLTAVEGESYLWSFQGETTQSVFIPAPDVSDLPLVSDYSVTITDVGGCQGLVEIVSVQLEWVPDVNVILAPEGGPVICVGESVEITAQTDASIFSWSNGETTNPIVVSPVLSTTYSVTVTNDFGCTSEGSVLIEALQECPDATCTCPTGNNLEDIGIDGEITNISDWMPFDNSGANCLSIKGTIIVDVDVGIGNCNIFLSPGSELIVEDGVYFDLQNDNIYACSEMWRGITVKDGGTLNFKNNYISGAQYAIKALDGSTLDIRQNTFDRNFVCFYVPPPAQVFGSNTISLIVQQAISSNNFICTTPLADPFIGQIPEPGDVTYAGILLNSVNNLRIGAQSGNISSYCSNLRNGVIAYNSNFELYGFGIQNMIGSNADLTPFYGTGTFNNAGLGVFVNHSYGLTMESVSVSNAFTGLYSHYSDVSVRKSTFASVDRGIRVGASEGNLVLIGHNFAPFGNNFSCRSEGVAVFGTSEPHDPNGPPGNGEWNYGSYIEIINNNISRVEGSTTPMVGIGIYNNLGGTQASGFSGGVADVTNNTIELTNNSATTFDVGIEISNSSFIKVKENQIFEGVSQGEKRMISMTGNHDCQVRSNYGTGTGINTSSALGIYVMNNTSTTYCCNVLNGLENGVRFAGMCDDTDLRGTTFENISTRGLLLQNGTTIGIQGDPNLPQTDYLSGNTWMNGAGAEHQGTLDEIDLSRIFYNMTFSNTFPAPGPIPAQGWFINTSALDPLICDDQPSCDVTEVNIIGDDPDIKLANGELTPDLYGGGIQWEGERHLYSKVVVDLAAYQAIPSVNNFYTAKSNASIGKFYEIEQDIANISDLNDPVTQDFYEKKQKVRKTLQSIDEKEELIKKSSTACHADLIEEIKELRTELLNLHAEVIQLESLYKENKSSEVGMIEAKNNGITPNNIVEENRKLINQIYLSTVAIQEPIFTSSQIQDLESVAGQCPLIGGNAVFMARGLLKSVMNINFNDDLICEGQENFSEERNDRSIFSGKEGLFIYPNPTTGKLNLKIDSGYNEGQELQIFDLAGKQVKSYTLPQGKQLFNFDLSSLDAGIYFYECILNGEKITGKIILLN